MAVLVRTAAHRPALRLRLFRHDDLLAVDLFSGFGGLTEGIKRAGFTTIMAANHNPYKVEIHEANHPEAEHWIADLVNPESSDYHSARDLPPADLLVAGVSCTNHSGANTQKAYEHGVSLFDMEDPDYEGRVTRSERDRATANCVLHYAAQHHPRMILVECTTELSSWGKLVPGRRKVGDGSTYRWWLKQFEILGYKHKVLYLNSRFFDVDQSRDRAYWVFWDKSVPAPDLEHRPATWCHRCDTVVEAKQTWKTGVPASGSVRYGKQYNYRCPTCLTEVTPPSGYSLRSMDLTDLGTRIGDRKRPLATATMDRAERCRQRFAEFPAVLMPAKSQRGSERHLGQPLATQTSQQETALLTTGALIAAAGNTYEHPGSNCRTRDLSQPLPSQTATNTQGLFTPPVALAVDNFQGAARGANEPLPTQCGSETMALVSSGVLPFRKNTTPTTHAEPMPTVTSEQVPGLLTATVETGHASERAPRTPADGNGTSGQEPLFTDWQEQHDPSLERARRQAPEQNGFATAESAGITQAEWRELLADTKLEDCRLRMMKEYEIGRGCGFDVNFGSYKGTFKVWGSARAQVDGFGNAVSPQVGTWIGGRIRDALHGSLAA
jgi:DNA (cytosine-5)-methyltransferase 1